MPDDSLARPAAVRPSAETLPERDDVSATFPIGTPHRVSFFPQVEEAALTTRRVDAASIALAVGLSPEKIWMCARMLGEGVELLATHDASAACYLFSVLRPRLVIVTAFLSDADGARLTSAAAAQHAELVCIGPGASTPAIAWRLQRSAAVAFRTVIRGGSHE